MRIYKPLRLILALALGTVSAHAVVPIRLAVPGLSFAPTALTSVLPATAAGITQPFSLSPMSLAPSLVPLGAPAAPLLLKPSVPAAVRPSILRLLPSMPAAGDPALNYADFFDGSVPAVDGAAVTPTLSLVAGRTLRRPLQLHVIQSAVQNALPALRESVALSGWSGPYTTLDESCCGDAAPKLALLLRAQGIPARLVEAEFHYYVILDLPDGQIVVDPTVRQFFGKRDAPKSIAPVFVGTISDLHVLFQRHAASKTTRYDPRRIYFRDAVVREEALRALETQVRDGGAGEHEPLRLFLGLRP